MSELLMELMNKEPEMWDVNTDSTVKLKGNRSTVIVIFNKKTHGIIVCRNFNNVPFIVPELSGKLLKIIAGSFKSKIRIYEDDNIIAKKCKIYGFSTKKGNAKTQYAGMIHMHLIIKKLTDNGLIDDYGSITDKGMKFIGKDYKLSGASDFLTEKEFRTLEGLDKCPMDHLFKEKE